MDFRVWKIGDYTIRKMRATQGLGRLNFPEFKRIGRTRILVNWRVERNGEYVFSWVKKADAVEWIKAQLKDEANATRELCGSPRFVGNDILRCEDLFSQIRD
jgi:hypothetical protein